jgi:hypothetical protein
MMTTDNANLEESINLLVTDTLEPRYSCMRQHKTIKFEIKFGAFNVFVLERMQLQFPYLP